MGSEDNGAQDPTMAEDTSIFNLTLDEIQSQLDTLGKPLNSMNLEELVTTVPATDSNSNIVFATNDNVVAVNEVPIDIQQGFTNGESAPEHPLVELTLEDFLAKAGIVSEASQLVPHSVIQQPTFLHCNQSCAQSHHNSMTYSQTSMSSPRSDTQSAGKKRVATGDISDKAAERRRRRMIKNRESAAKSRERKQAYMQQLELKLAELEAENAKLKAAEAPTALPLVTKIQLHRTRSAPL